MNWFALVGYILVCIWQPLQIYKIARTGSAHDLSIGAISVMSLGMMFIQMGFIADGAGPVYQIGNGFAVFCSLILIGQYIYYAKKNHGSI